MKLHLYIPVSFQDCKNENTPKFPSQKIRYNYKKQHSDAIFKNNLSHLLKLTFWQFSIYSQSLVKILWQSDKDKITFKAIEKDRYGL